MSSARSYLLPMIFVAGMTFAACGSGEGDPQVSTNTATVTPSEGATAAPATPSGQSSVGGAGDLAVTYRSLEEITRDADAVVVIEFTSVSSQMYSGLPFTVGEAVIREALTGPLRVGDTITYAELGAPIYVGGSKLDPSATIVSQVPASGGIHWIEAGETYLIFLVGPTHIGPVREGGYAPAGAFQGKYRLIDNGIIEFDPDMSWEDAFTVPKLLDGKKWADVRPDIKKILAAKP